MPVIPTATPNRPRIVREESPASNDNTKKAPDIKNDGQLHPIRQIKTPPKKPPVSKDGVQIIQKKDEVILNLRGIDSSTDKVNSISADTIKNKQPQDTKDSNLVKEPNTAAPKKRRRRRKRKPNQPNTASESSSSKEQKTSSD